jgi:hypothetical protein
VFASAPRRLVALILLLGFGAAFASPVLAMQASHAAKMKCCKRGKGACCKRHKPSTGPAWTAINTCAAQCSTAAPATQLGGFEAPAAVASHAAVYDEVDAGAADHVAQGPGSYLAFLYQLPPPANL